jgi:alpha,alpha-trehalase
MKVYSNYNIKDLILVRILNSMNVVIVKKSNDLHQQQQQHVVSVKRIQQFKRQLGKMVLKHSSALDDLLSSLSHSNAAKLAIDRKFMAHVNNTRAFSNQAEQLYLNEKYLRVVKLANERVDSKYIVDRATRRPVHQVLASLRSLDETNLDEIRRFVEHNLHEPGVEITRAEFTDWTHSPRFVQTLKSDKLKHFSLELNRIWLDLYKKFDTDKLDANCVSSHLPMKHPFIVPGGRFIEMYYWDTYWTIEGLLVCGMFDTVRELLENFIQFIDQYGFIPNGSRVYYLNRSQPPYFSQMCMRFYEFSASSTELSRRQKLAIRSFVLDKALFYMIREYEYWMKHKSVEIPCLRQDGQGVVTHRLNLFNAMTDQPRPESYFEDIHTANHLNCNAKKAKLYKDIATAAE